MFKHNTTLFQWAGLREVQTVSDVLDNYIEDCEAGGLSSETLRTYRYNVERLIAHLEHGADACIAEITEDVLRSFFAKLQRRELSPYTIDQRWRMIHGFLEWCIDKEMLTENPLQGVKRPKLPKNRQVPRLSKEQFQRVLRAAMESRYSERNVALVMLMGDAGLRRGEIVKLNMNDLHLDEQFIEVNGKGDKDRSVPLSNPSVEALEQWLEVRPDVDHSAVFTGRYGARITGDAIRFTLYRIRDKAGLDVLYPHLLRHTYARLFLLGGGDLKSLQEILGHEKASTTADIYLEPDIDDLKQVQHRCSPMSQ